MTQRLSIPWPYVILLACPLTVASASSLPDRPEQDTCRKASCFFAHTDDHKAEYVFGAAMSTEKDRMERDDYAGWGKDQEYGPARVPPVGKPDVIHTGSGKDIFPGPFAAGHYPKPAAVPVPPNLWLLISGAVGLGLGAGRRKHG